MKIKKMEGIIEAILFTMGESVELDKIARTLEQDVETTRKVIHNMMDRYEKEDRGIHIIELENAFQMCTKKDTYEYLIRIAKQPKRHVLTDVALETLSIIAYKQPITRAEVDDIRGVNSSGAIAKLQAFDLIQEVGKKDAVGRPNLYATTDYFLDYMGINSLDELVAIDQLELEDQETSLFREDASEELEDFDN